MPMPPPRRSRTCCPEPGIPTTSSCWRLARPEASYAKPITADRRRTVQGPRRVVAGHATPDSYDWLRARFPDMQRDGNALAIWGILRSRLDEPTISREQAHRLLRCAGAAPDNDGQPLLRFDLLPRSTGKLVNKFIRSPARFSPDVLGQSRE